MTQGITGSYAINGTEITIQPTSGQWMPREPLGVDGNGHFVYSPFREYEMTWGLLDTSEANQLQNFFNSLGNTGTVIVDLPKYADLAYEFFSYTGCVLQEPSFGTFFVEHYSNVSLLVIKIRT